MRPTITILLFVLALLATCCLAAPFTCPENHTRIVVKGKKYCVNLEAQDRAEAGKQKVIALYHQVLWPNNLKALHNHTLIEEYFTADAKGSIGPVGQYTDTESTGEYFFALSGPITEEGDQASNCATGFRVRRMESSGQGDDHIIVASHVELIFKVPCFGEQFVYRNLTQLGFFTIETATNKISSYDLHIINLGRYADFDDPIVREAAIGGVCYIATNMCNNVTMTGHEGMDHPAPTGPIYEDMQDCLEFMHSIPYGTWDRAVSNSVTCRLLHAQLALVRPAQHCSHISRDGGGKCHDVTYESFFDREF